MPRDVQDFTWSWYVVGELIDLLDWVGDVELHCLSDLEDACFA